MLSNYFRVAWRNLVKQKQFTILNLLGLSTGLACILLIYLWVNDELHIDKFNEKDSQLYQVMKTSPNSDGTVSTWGVTQGMLAREIKKSYPEIEYAAAVRREDETGVLIVGDKRIKASWQFADQDFFDIFSYPLIEGKKENALSNKYGVYLSDKFARKLFGTVQSIVGKTITWDAGKIFSGPYIISGVFKAPPANASDQFDILFPYQLFVDKELGTMGDATNWGSNNVNTYLILRKGTDIKKFSAKIKDYTKMKMKSMGIPEDWLKWEGDLLLQKYSDEYLYNRYENGKVAGGRIEYIKLFSVIAIFILVIACINFMNLSTAKAAARMKEVGVRKVIGASRKALVFQYMGESMLMSFTSVLIAVAIASLLLAPFREITGKELSLSVDLNFVMAVLAIAVITGVIAGSYPALYLSGFKPALVLKGKLTASASESVVRKGLVVFQFVISVVLIIAVVVVYQQMKLVQTKNLGYNKDNIIRFPIDGKLHEQPETFLSEIRNIPGVVAASAMDGDFLEHPGHSGGGIDWEGKDPNLGIEYYGVSGDYGYMELLGLKMAAGRTFSKEFGSDSSSVIFNESAIAAMGIKNPIGKTVSLWGKKKQIIGIVKDFHFESLYKKVGPAFLEYLPKFDTKMLVKIKAGTEKSTIAKLEAFYKSFNQGLPFEYKFMDEDYQAMYSSEEKVAVLSRYFATIAIIISCLGLFGLAAFTAQKRQKEIGIRKVIGASVNNIALMLSKDFLKLVIMAILIAFPLAWFTMNKWLQGFAYRVNISASVFAIAAATVIFITVVTVSFQAIKAALANPVKSLRAE